MTKLFALSPLYMILTVLCSFTISIFMTSLIIGGVDSTPTYKEMEIIDDLPVKSNLEKYLLALEKAVYFINAHRLYVDVNLNFGIFLVNVNLKTTLQMRGHRLSAQKRVRLERLVKTNDEIQKYFAKMVSKYMSQIEQNEEVTLSMVNLFTNDTLWPNQLRTFNIDLLKKTKFYSRKELEKVFFKWPLYKKGLVFMNIPSPKDSDTCLDLLAQNPLNDKPKLVHCQVPYTCANAVLNGTRCGYGMTHRILFLILARYARGCALLTPAEDKDLLDELCARVYNEGEFIGHHDFELADLFMEQISLCSLEGHAQFIRRSWIDEGLDFQTAPGCFNITRPSPEEEGKELPAAESFSWQLSTQQMILGGTCCVHTTAVGVAMLGAAIRYILENYY